MNSNLSSNLQPLTFNSNLPSHHPITYILEVHTNTIHHVEATTIPSLFNTLINMSWILMDTIVTMIELGLPVHETWGQRFY